MNDQHVEKKAGTKEVSASKYSGYHAAAVSNDIEQEWQSKHLYLIEEAEKQKVLLEQKHQEEEQQLLMETKQGNAAFFDMMHHRGGGGKCQFIL